jgi:hypothetical protein
MTMTVPTHERDGGGSDGPRPVRTHDIDEQPPRSRRGRPTLGGPADVVYVLCLLQVGFGLLAAVGEELMMGGSPLYLVLPLARAGLLLVLATRAVTGRRWALVALIVASGLTLTAFCVEVGVSVLPAVGLTVNLAGLVTNVALPVIVIVACGQILRERSA